MKKNVLMVGWLMAMMGGMEMQGQEPPRVYSVENTGSGFVAPVMPAATELPEVHDLPDALAWADGSGRVSTFAEWERRRNEIAAQIQHYGIGT